jgi:hypothetical protein
MPISKMQLSPITKRRAHGNPVREDLMKRVKSLESILYSTWFKMKRRDYCCLCRDVIEAHRYGCKIIDQMKKFH